MTERGAAYRRLMDLADASGSVTIGVAREGKGRLDLVAMQAGKILAREPFDPRRPDGSARRLAAKLLVDLDS